MKQVLIFSFSLLLVACGGGGGGAASSTAQSMGGVWLGTASPVGGGGSIDMVGIISEAGELHFLSDVEIDIGSVTTSGNTFSGNVTAYTTGSTASGTVSGTFTPRSSFSGTGVFGGTPTSNFAFTYDDSYERASSLALISGTYSDTDGAYTETYTIGSDGALTGSDTDGCVFNGQVSIIDSRYNAYDITLTISNCIATTTLNGLAALGDDTGTNDLLYVSAGNSTYAVIGLVNRI